MDFNVTGVEIWHALDIVQKRKDDEGWLCGVIKLWLSEKSLQNSLPVILLLLIFMIITIIVPLQCHTWLISWTPYPWRFHQDTRSYHSECTRKKIKRSYFCYFYGSARACLHVCLFVEVLFKLCLLIKGTVKLSWAAGEKRPLSSFVNRFARHGQGGVCAQHVEILKKDWKKERRVELKVWCSCSSHPEGASLTELEHPKHTILKLHSAVELGQVVVINSQQLKREEVKWQEGFERDRREERWGLKKAAKHLSFLWDKQWQII